MRLAGIDPGRRHLGVCIIECSDDCHMRITKWTVCEVDDSSPRAFLETASDILEALIGVDRIYIERQPPKNSSMCRVQQYLQMYLEIKTPHSHVSIVQAAKRTKFLKTHAPHLAYDTYYQRKKSSVTFVESVLESSDQPLTSRFTHAAKRDDYAESFLLVYIHLDLEGRQ